MFLSDRNLFYSISVYKGTHSVALTLVYKHEDWPKRHFRFFFPFFQIFSRFPLDKFAKFNMVVGRRLRFRSTSTDIFSIQNLSWSEKKFYSLRYNLFLMVSGLTEIKKKIYSEKEWLWSILITAFQITCITSKCHYRFAKKKKKEKSKCKMRISTKFGFSFEIFFGYWITIENEK